MHFQWRNTEYSTLYICFESAITHNMGIHALDQIASTMQDAPKPVNLIVDVRCGGLPCFNPVTMLTYADSHLPSARTGFIILLGPAHYVVGLVRIARLAAPRLASRILVASDLAEAHKLLHYKRRAALQRA